MEYFITGIDTDIGKTYVTKCLASYFIKQGKTVGVFKPLQSGAINNNGILIAPDIESVKEVSSNIKTKYSYLLEGEVSPALAARLAKVKIDINKIKSDFENFKKENDVTLVEGAGGILAPVSDNMLCADLIKNLNLPIIIVTVPFLGRLNHTLLTVDYAINHGIKIKGIIVNKIPTNTDDLATLHFVEELKMYTSVDIIGYINQDSDTIKKEI